MAQNLELALKIRADIKQARKEIRAVRDELKQFGRGGKSAQSGVRGLNQELDKTEKKMVGISDTARNVRRALIGLGVIAIFKTAIQNTARQEQALAQVEQRIRSTGGAAGLTTQQLSGMASALQKITTFGDEAVLELQALLLTFTQIQGPILERATRLTLDMSVAMEQDLKSSAIQLGKALNDPKEGLTALSRVGVRFSTEQERLIKSLVETGRVAEAQTLILNELETEFGGSAEAARDTFGGALEAVKNVLGDLLEAPGSLPNATDALELLAYAFSTVSENSQELANDDSLTDWGESAAELFAFVADAARTSGFTIRQAFGITGETLGAGFAQLVAVLKGEFERAKTIGDEWYADVQRRNEEVLAYDAEALRNQLQALRKARKERQKERAIDQELQKIDREFAALDGNKQVLTEGAEKGRQALNKLNESLLQQIQTFGKGSAAALEYRLHMGDLKDEVAALGPEGKKLAEGIIAQAQQLEKLKAAKESEQEAERKRQQLEREGASLTESLRTEQEIYNAKLEDYKLKLDAGVISLETYNRAKAAAAAQRDAKDRASLESILDENDATRPLQRQLEVIEKLRQKWPEYADSLDQASVKIKERMEEIKNGTDELDQFAIQGARNIQSSLADFLFDPFKDGLKGMARSFADTLRRMAAEAAAAHLAKSLFGDYGKTGKVGGVLGNIFSAIIKHDGGLVGAGGPTRAVPALAFAGAPRFHSGGVAGIGPDEYPAILQRGEEVLTQDDPRHVRNGGGMGSGPVTVNIFAQDANSFRRARDQVTSDIARAVARGQARNG